MKIEIPIVIDNKTLEEAIDKRVDELRQEGDFVIVTRCKDCKHRYVPTRCALWYASADDKEYFVERGDDFYCAFAESKEIEGVSRE